MKKFIILIIPFLFAGCMGNVETKLQKALQGALEYTYMQAQIDCLENGASVEKIGEDWQWTDEAKKECEESFIHNYLSEYKLGFGK